MNLRSTDTIVTCHGRSDCCPGHTTLADRQGIAPEDRGKYRIRIVREIRTINGEWNIFDAPPELGEVFLATDVAGLVVCTGNSDFVQTDDGKNVGTSTFGLWPQLGDAFVTAFGQWLDKPGLMGVELGNIPAFGDRTAGQRTRWN